MATHRTLTYMFGYMYIETAHFPTHAVACSAAHYAHLEEEDG